MVLGTAVLGSHTSVLGGSVPTSIVTGGIIPRRRHIVNGQTSRVIIDNPQPSQRLTLNKSDPRLVVELD